MKERINWIDWAKSWCMTVVVFDHTPHDSNPFLLQFLAGTNLATFFFISGYLKKPAISQEESLKKYFYGIIIPYFLYNFIYYPYWFTKSYIQHGRVTIETSIKPILGTLLGQLDSSFSTSLNGVTWFLLSLFIMHIITDYCNRCKHRVFIMMSISILSMILYGANKYLNYAPYLTFHGLVRCLPFFFLGHLMRESKWLKEIRFIRELGIGIMAMATSLLLFYWHINVYNSVFHIILYFVVNIISIFAVISFWRCLNRIRLNIIFWISIGTMMIFGLHRMIIGIIDFSLEKFFHINDITYTTLGAMFITIAIELFLLPFIYYTYRHALIFLGKRKTL